MTDAPSDRPRWWQWPTVLSLDAPAIAVVWQAAIARSVGVSLSWPHVLILGASVWLAYTADRWIESWRLGRRPIVTARHRFHQRRRWEVLAALVIVLGANVGTALTMLGVGDLLAGMVLALAVLAYLLSHQWLHRHAAWRVPKEVLVALLLSAGVWLFVRQAPADALAGPLTLFLLLCFVNCALISRWEAAVDRVQEQTSLVQSRVVARVIPWLPWLVLLVAIGLWLAGPAHHRVLSASSMVSALLLAVVDRAEPRMGWRLARVLSDAALLTPLATFALR